MKTLSLAVLASGRGTNLQALLEAQDKGTMKAQVKVVLSDKKDAPALERARERGIPAFSVNPGDYPEKKLYEEALLQHIRQAQVDYILLAGYMRVLSAYFISGAQVPILNIHPALLPSFPGLHAQRQAVDYGVRFSGCTVHFVDEGVDSGPVILQAVVPVFPEDSEEDLSLRILREEHRLYPKAVQMLAEGRIVQRGRKVLIIGEVENHE